MHAEIGRFARKSRVIDILLSMYDKTYEIFTNIPLMDKFIEQRESEKGKDRIIQSLKNYQKDLIKEKERTEAERDIYKEMVSSGNTAGNSVYVFNNISGQIFLGEFNKVIAQLNSKGLNKIAEVLINGQRELISQRSLDKVEKQELIEVLERIGEEAMKAKPNKTILKSLNEGLKIVSNVIPDVIKTVDSIIRP